MTSIERTAYPRFKRLITARELLVFFSPSGEEAAWAAERTQSEDHRSPTAVAPRRDADASAQLLASASRRIHWSKVGLSTVVMTLTVVRR
ncbi:hypothetical protein GCM10020219_065300 [Nonomuraea dietziae]